MNSTSSSYNLSKLGEQAFCIADPGLPPNLRLHGTRSLQRRSLLSPLSPHVYAPPRPLIQFLYYLMRYL